jgi:hypothetical protein
MFGSSTCAGGGEGSGDVSIASALIEAWKRTFLCSGQVEDFTYLDVYSSCRGTNALQVVDKTMTSHRAKLG